jgi:anti-sigma regulatory factor (Ser/Thr protein kinase)
MEVLNANVRIEIAEQSQVSEARRVAMDLARRLGFSDLRVGELAIVVTEAATNMLKHSGGGELLLGPTSRNGNGDGLGVIAVDSGPGMANVTECFRDGFSTAGSPGTGLGAITRLSSWVDVFAPPPAGTILAAALWPEGNGVQSIGLETGGICLPKSGESECGDAWRLHSAADHYTLFMVDGLGHGTGAAAAAQAALTAFDNNAEAAPVAILQDIHAALRSTRGAAAAVARLDLVQRVVRYAGIGNIAAVIYPKDAMAGPSRQMVSMNGILGHQAASFREFSYPWPKGSLLIMHSDGLGSKWDLAKYPGLTGRPPLVVAGVLYRDYERKRDDVTVVAARERADF